MRLPLKRAHKAAQAALLAVTLLATSNAYAANDWVNFATVSMTDPTTPKLTNGYGCRTDGKDILCDSAASAVNFGTGGLIDYGGMTVAGSISASAVSATYVSGTVIQVNTSAMPCSTGLAGAIRYNSGNIEYCNGSSWGQLANGSGGTLSGGSATAIAFWNGPTSLTYESATTSGLYWDHAKSRLGIGTNHPTFGVDMSTSTGGIRAFMNSSTMPAFEVDTSATDNLAFLRVRKGGKARWDFGSNAAPESGGNAGSDFYLNRFGDNESFLGTALLIERKTGNVGIGTTAPGSSLTIIGEAQVGSSGAACVSASNGGAIRYSAGTLYYCNGANTWSTISGGGAGFTGGGSATAIAFWNGTNSLTYESATTSGLYWDHTNGRLGVGTSAPWTPLAVSGTAGTLLTMQGYGNQTSMAFTSGTTTTFQVGVNNWPATNFFIYDVSGSRPVLQAFPNSSLSLMGNGGNVGIGTASPGSSLTIVGEVQPGSSGAACVTATNGGAIRYSAGALYYCNGSNTWSAISGGGAGFTGGGSATAIAFWNGAGSLTYESDTTSGLYWDHANHRLGIGTNTPGVPLTVSGGAIMSVNTTADRAIYMSGNGGSGTPILQGTNASNAVVQNIALQPYGGNVGVGGFASPTATLQVSGTFTVSTSTQGSTSPSLYVGSNGNIGMGTSNPNAALEINGSSGLTVMSVINSANDSGVSVQARPSYGLVQGVNYAGNPGKLILNAFTGSGANVGVATQSPTATLQVNGTFTVSSTGQNSLSSASLAVDTRGVSVSSIVHINGSPFSPIGAGGNAILSGTTAVSTSMAGSITFYAGGARVGGFKAYGTTFDANGVTLAGDGGYLGLGAYWDGSNWVNSTSSQGGAAIRNSSGVMTFYTDASPGTAGTAFSSFSEKMRLQSNGYLSLGTTAGSAHLHIAGDTNNGVSWPKAGIILQDTGTNGRTFSISSRGSAGFGIADETSHLVRLIIAPNGVATFYGTSNCTIANGTGTTSCTSDRRLKDRIEPIKDPLDKLMLIKGVTYHWKRKDISGPEHIGVIAQDVEKAFPQAVTEVSDTTIGTAKTVDYAVLVAPIIEVIRDFKHRFESTDVRLKAANDNIQTLSNEVEELRQEVRELKQQRQ